MTTTTVTVPAMHATTLTTSTTATTSTSTATTALPSAATRAAATLVAASAQPTAPQNGTLVAVVQTVSRSERACACSVASRSSPPLPNVFDNVAYGACLVLDCPCRRYMRPQEYAECGFSLTPRCVTRACRNEKETRVHLRCASSSNLMPFLRQRHDSRPCAIGLSRTTLSATSVTRLARACRLHGPYSKTWTPRLCR